MYWTPQASAGVVAYNLSTDADDQNRIYNTYLDKPFRKLVENVFNTFKFCYNDNGPETAQHECLSHVIANIHKFDPTKVNKLGNKVNAFSYFSIVAKHYLIMTNNATYQRQLRFESLDVGYGDSNADDHYTHDVPDKLVVEEDAPYVYSSKTVIKHVVDFFEENIPKIFKNGREVCIANAVLEILRNSDRIDVFNKKALYLYIREISGYSTSQITFVINKMKKYFRRVVEQYKNKGELNSHAILVDPSIDRVDEIELEQPVKKVKRPKTKKSEFSRKCEKCGHVQFYASKVSYNTAITKKSKCNNCKK